MPFLPGIKFDLIIDASQALTTFVFVFFSFFFFFFFIYLLLFCLFTYLFISLRSIIFLYDI